MRYNLESLVTYVSEEALIDGIAEAWLVLSDPDDGEGKGNVDVFGLERAYLSDDWSKMARRTIRGFAEANPRPDRYPWNDSRFDRFGWKS